MSVCPELHVVRGDLFQSFFSLTTTLTLLPLNFPLAVPHVHVLSITFTSCLLCNSLSTNYLFIIPPFAVLHPPNPQQNPQNTKPQPHPSPCPHLAWSRHGGQGPEFKQGSTGNDCSPWHPGPDLSTPPLFICLCPTTYSLLGHVGQDAPITFTLSPPNRLVCLVVSFTAPSCKTVKRFLFRSKMFWHQCDLLRFQFEF